MKIPSNAPPTSVLGVRPKANQKKARESAANRTAPQQTCQAQSALQQRISYWFSQIGVTPHAIDIRSVEPQEIANYRRLKERNSLINLKNIMGVAMEVSSAQIPQEQLDPDWFHAFTSMAETIYSRAMQELWGKILAVEVQKPGSFSLRTLSTLTKLTQRDAVVFTHACQLSCKRNADSTPIIVTGCHQKSGLLTLLAPATNNAFALHKHGVSYADVLALGNMKVLYATEMETGLLPTHTPQSLKFAKTTLHLTPKKRNLWLSYFRFTAVGSELSQLIPRHESDSFIGDIHHQCSRYFVIERQ